MLTKKLNWLGFFRAVLAAMALCAAMAPAVGHAQNVLLLTTDESSQPDAVASFANIVSEFTSAGATVTVSNQLTTSGGVTPATFVSGGGANYDIVIMSSAYFAVHPSNWSAINAAIATRKANAFIMFNDGCCVAANISSMAASVAATGAFTPTVGPLVIGIVSAILNTGSPYSASFLGLNPFVGGWISYFQNVPAANALYLAPGSAIPVAGATVNDVFGLLVPTPQSYAGAGACLFATVDSSPFSDVAGLYALNKGKIAPAFLNAVKPGGACGLPAAISKSFAPASIAAGGTATLTISVVNGGGGDVGGLNVTDPLPAPLVVAGPATSTCAGGTLSAVNASALVSLTGATLPAAGCTITVPVRWPLAQASLCTPIGTAVTNTIRPGIEFTTSLGQVNTPATAQLSCNSTLAPAVVAPVPTLSQWALAVLALVLGCFAGWQRTARSGQ